LSPTPSEAGSGSGAKRKGGLARNAKGETALHRAAIKGDLAAVRALLDDAAGAGAVNATDNAGWTALHEACNHNHARVVEALLEAGANVNLPGYLYETPLHDAINNDHVDIALILLKVRVSVAVRVAIAVAVASLCSPRRKHNTRTMFCSCSTAPTATRSTATGSSRLRWPAAMRCATPSPTSWCVHTLCTALARPRRFPADDRLMACPILSREMKQRNAAESQWPAAGDSQAARPLDSDAPAPAPPDAREVVLLVTGIDDTQKAQLEQWAHSLQGLVVTKASDAGVC
jgi:hypothetical protein